MFENKCASGGQCCNVIPWEVLLTEEINNQFSVHMRKYQFIATYPNGIAKRNSRNVGEVFALKGAKQT